MRRAARMTRRVDPAARVLRASDARGRARSDRQGARARLAAGLASGVIVEVEAYIGESDPACHAAPGPTARNAPLYGPPGFAYVYLNYGIHYLVNAVTEAEGSPAAVLIRALEPLDGEALDAAAPRARHRPSAPPRSTPTELCRGPGNLTRALGITLRHNRLDLTAGALRIEDRGLPPRDVAWSRRIGITVGVEWRGARQSAVSAARQSSATSVGADPVKSALTKRLRTGDTDLVDSAG